MKIGVTAYVTQKTLARAKKHSCEAIFYTHANQLGPDLLRGMKLIDGSNYYNLAEHAYPELEAKVSELETNFSFLMEHKKIPLVDAFLKEFYWIYLSEFAGKSGVRLCKEINEQDTLVSLTTESVFKSLVKIARLWLSNSTVVGKKAKTRLLHQVKGQTLFIINGAAQVEILKPVLKYLTSYSFINNAQQQFSLEDNGQVVNSSMSVTSGLGLRLRQLFILLLGCRIHDVVSILRVRQNLIRYYNLYQPILAEKPKSILSLALENNGEGIVIAELSRKYGVRSCNAMNGVKGIEPINKRTNFDYWFMHNSATQQLIADSVGLKKERIPVVGHLEMDRIRDFEPAGIYGSCAKPEQITIAFFTSPIFAEEQLSALSYLEKLSEVKQFKVLFRAHPNDKRKVYKEYVDRLSNFIEPDESISKQENSLYELFSIVSFVLTFNSTVSLQSSWFLLPTISVEFGRDKSSLPYVDGEKIIHVGNQLALKKELEKFLNSPSNRGKAQFQKNGALVGETISRYLTHELG